MIMKCTWLNIENTCKTCITRGTHGVQSHGSIQAHDVWFEPQSFWRAVCGYAVACDVTNHKWARRNEALWLCTESHREESQVSATV